MADNFGIHLLDTAQAYGDAEQVLGRNLVNGHNFKIISKLVPWIKLLLYLTIRIGKKSFQRVVTGTCQKQITPLTIRFKKPGSEYLENWLVSLRDRQLVDKLEFLFIARRFRGVNPEL